MESKVYDGLSAIHKILVFFEKQCMFVDEMIFMGLIRALGV